jgi:hypothetical protein
VDAASKTKIMKSDSNIKKSLKSFCLCFSVIPMPEYDMIIMDIDMTLKMDRCNFRDFNDNEKK